MTRSWIVASVLGLVGAVVALPAAGARSAAAQAAQDRAAAGAPESAPYASPMREQCEAELRRDVRWRADLRQDLTPQIHAEDADEMLRNKQHVVYAYATLWIIMLGFVLYMWRRNTELTDQLSRLEREIRAATGHGGGPGGSPPAAPGADRATDE